HPQQECHQKDHPQLYEAHQRDDAEDERQEAHQRLGEHEEAPLVDAVGYQPCPGADEEDWKKLQSRNQSQGDATARQVKDQPGPRHPPHPASAHGDPLTSEVQPVVADAQRGERLHGDPPDGHQRASQRSSSSRRSRTPAASLSTSSSRSSTRANRAARYAVLRLRLRCSRSRPREVTATSDTRRSASSTDRVTRPWASSEATIVVMVGGLTPSGAAGSPREPGPCRAIVPSADSPETVRPLPACCRSRRLRRVTASLSRPASRARSIEEAYEVTFAIDYLVYRNVRIPRNLGHRCHAPDARSSSNRHIGSPGRGG